MLRDVLTGARAVGFGLTRDALAGTVGHVPRHRTGVQRLEK